MSSPSESSKTGQRPLPLVLGLLAVLGATVLGTRYVLSLLPSEQTSAAEEEVTFLAHLLLPLSVSLMLILAIAVVGGVFRVVAALRRSRSSQDQRM